MRKAKTLAELFQDAFRGMPGIEMIVDPGIGDLWWLPLGTREEIFAAARADPPFWIMSYTRVIAFQQFAEEIRLAARPIDDGGLPGWWDPAQRDRVAAIQAEPDVCEYGAVRSVEDAITYARAYLQGESFDKINVVRHYGAAPGGWQQPHQVGTIPSSR